MAISKRHFVRTGGRPSALREAAGSYDVTRDAISRTDDAHRGLGRATLGLAKKGIRLLADFFSAGSAGKVADELARHFRNRRM